MSDSAVDLIRTRFFEEMLESVSPRSRLEIHNLFQETSPTFILDRVTKDICFKASVTQKSIVIGLKATMRLQAHAYAASAILSELAAHRGCTDTKSDNPRLSCADNLSNWAVGNELKLIAERLDYSIEGTNPFSNIEADLSPEQYSDLSESDRRIGNRFFKYALCFITLHELAHLKFKHEGSTIENEKAADRFASDWLIEASMSYENDSTKRFFSQCGVAICFLWLMCHNIFIGRKDTRSHPQAYDRFYQTLENMLVYDDADQIEQIWDFTARLLLVHMSAAGFQFDSETDFVHLREGRHFFVNHLLNRISQMP